MPIKSVTLEMLEKMERDAANLGQKESSESSEANVYRPQYE